MKQNECTETTYHNLNGRNEKGKARKNQCIQLCGDDWQSQSIEQILQLYLRPFKAYPLPRCSINLQESTNVVRDPSLMPIKLVC